MMLCVCTLCTYFGVDEVRALSTEEISFEYWNWKVYKSKNRETRTNPDVLSVHYTHVICMQPANSPYRIGSVVHIRNFY